MCYDAMEWKFIQSLQYFKAHTVILKYNKDSKRYSTINVSLEFLILHISITFNFLR